MIDGAGGIAFGAALTTNIALATLDLGDNELGVAGVSAIAAGLASG